MPGTGANHSAGVAHAESYRSRPLDAKVSQQLPGAPHVPLSCSPLFIPSEFHLISTYQVEDSFRNYFQSKYKDILKDILDILLHSSEIHKSLPCNKFSTYEGKQSLRWAYLDEK